MDIGIVVGDARGPSSARDLVDRAEQVRDAGLGTVWASKSMGWDALVALATVGAAVPGLRLGAGVVPVPVRHPLVLASQALSVQAATGNRLTLGIGAGVAALTERMFGLVGDRPAHRLREYLEVLLPLLRGEGVDHRGATLTAFGQVDVPDAEPPEVLLAALGPRMLRVAGELTAGTITWMTGVRTLGEHIVPTISRVNPGARVVAGLLACVTDDEAGVRQQVAEQFALAGQVPEYRAMLDREGVAGPGDVVVVGTESTVVGHLDRLRDAGVTDFMAMPYGSAREQARTLTVLAG
ncbi:TIGR03564 family F420-dependent LLM class oxidoreductase [Actinophytocola oryzae]|uniref:F420-dependent oxidoreductase-like protein n=1 Tax=Actinophytocola oryzae TaxID=502181 RepID=A0A4R7VUY1_9PSEU|nr:TIGR03564 family F420-dependent LLM class oxidoreductase [Actinophytocola oryzae]TDV53664.1 F420-dependent oxidoreductase-like protein [Actinophytocola oryzae]